MNENFGEQHDKTAPPGFLELLDSKNYLAKQRALFAMKDQYREKMSQGGMSEADIAAFNKEAGKLAEEVAELEEKIGSRDKDHLIELNMILKGAYREVPPVESSENMEQAA